MKKYLSKIREFYWSKVSYNWRPRTLWYRFKCLVWHRYTTIKCRYLSHTWHDRSEVLPHTMFEILSRFVEKECPTSCTEWYGEWGPKVQVNGEEKYVRDEMQHIYDWWHAAQTEYSEVTDLLFDEAKKHLPLKSCVPVNHNDEEVDEDEAAYFLYDPTYKSEEDEMIYNKCMSGVTKIEQIYEAKINEMCHRLINIREHLWT